MTNNDMKKKIEKLEQKAKSDAAFVEFTMSLLNAALSALELNVSEEKQEKIIEDILNLTK